MSKSLSRAEKFTNQVYANHKILNKGGMSYDQHLLIAETIEECKPKRILEIGVQMGCTSAFLLRYLSLAGHNETKLYSVDIISDWLQPDTGVRHVIGEEVTKQDAPSENWKLVTGKPVGMFHDQLGADFDICIIDTSHVYPGEIFDFLMALPLLKENASVFIHDINMDRDGKYSDVTSMLFSAIPGVKKLPTSNYFGANKPNIGLVKIDSDIYNKLTGVFNLLLVKWQQSYQTDYLNWLYSFLSNFYDEQCMRLFTIASYKNTNSDLSSLARTSCQVCCDNGEVRSTVLNDEGVCQICGATKAQRVLRKTVNCVESYFLKKQVLADKKDLSLPSEISTAVNDINEIEIDKIGDDKFSAVVLNINEGNLQKSLKVLVNPKSILLANGIMLVSLIDLPQSVVAENEALCSLTSKSQEYMGCNLCVFYEVDCSSSTVEPLYVITSNNSIDELIVDF